MVKEIKLEQLAGDKDESQIVFWHVTEGERMNAGDVLVDIQTAKAVTEIKAKENGIIAEIIVQRGESARPGEVLATFEPVSEEAEAGQAEQRQERKRKMPSSNSQKTTSVGRISPKLRRLARQLSVEIHDIRGTGKGNQITEEDIERAAKKRKPSQVPAVPFTGMRRRIAKRMMESLQTSAQVTMTGWADVTRLEAERKSKKNISWTAIMAKAVTTALHNHPNLNVHIKEERIFMYENVHLAVAIETEGGVHVPVIRDAGNMTMDELDREIVSLSEKARKRSLSLEESSGSTFTITNLGGHAVEFFTPVINPPEAAILGIGRIETYLVLEEGTVVERRRLPLSLTFDHRAIDGSPAARFLDDLTGILENPEKLLSQVYQV